MSDEREIEAVLADAQRIANENRRAAFEGVMIRREHAAQLAERANVERDHDPLTRSADYLDGYVDGFEKAAEIIRRGQLRLVKFGIPNSEYSE